MAYSTFDQSINSKIGGSLISADAKPPRTAFDAAHSTFSLAREVASYAKQIAATACGSVPECGETGSGQRIADGVFENLTHGAESTARELSEAMEALRRLANQIS